MRHQALNRGALLRGQSEGERIIVEGTPAEVLVVTGGGGPDGVRLEFRPAKPETLLMEADGPRPPGIFSPCLDGPFSGCGGAVEGKLNRAIHHWERIVEPNTVTDSGVADAPGVSGFEVGECSCASARSRDIQTQVGCFLCR